MKDTKLIDIKRHSVFIWGCLFNRYQN